MATANALKSILPRTLCKSSSLMLGCIIHSVGFGELEIIEKGAMVINEYGIIQKVVNLETEPQFKESIKNYNQVLDYTGKLIIPGFVDAHCHAPQYVFSGTGMDLPLLAWLEKYTFPCEAKFSDTKFARIAYEKSIKRHLKCGTTFASYFATIHNEACKVLVEVIQQVGQRAHVGKVSMDRNSPDFYIEETTSGCTQAEDFVKHCLALTPVGREFLQQVKADGIASDVACKRARAISMEDDAISVRSAAFTDVESSSSVADFSLSRHPRTVSIASNNGDELDWSRHSRSDLDYSRHGYGSEIDISAHGAMLGDAMDISRHGRSELDSSRHEISSSGNKRAFSESSCSAKTDNICENMPPPLAPRTRTIDTLLNKPYAPLVMPCITPRFVPTCTGDMMKKLGEIAAKYALPVQSHMSESVNEIQWVSELHPDCPTYASVYEKFGLMHGRTYMAHCCHSPPDERAVLASTGASVVHCASSNFMLSSGVMDVRQFLEEGIKVALGTDVAGGYSPSMLDALRQSVIASRVKGFDYRCFKPPAQATDDESVNSSITGSSSVSDKNSSTEETNINNNTSAKSTASASAAAASKAYRSLNYLEAFHLATVGGAEVLGMGDVVGNFLPGKSLDCLVIDVHTPDSPIDTFEHESHFDYFQKFLFLGDDRNITSVFVQGRQVI